MGLPRHIGSPFSLNRTCDKLIHALQDTIKAEVPHMNICVKSKRWWSKELTLMRKGVEKMGQTTYKLKHWMNHPAAATPENRSGHYLADMFLTAASSLWKARGHASYSLTLRWTAGHVKIEGNELADEEAKKAAEGTTSDPSTLPKILKKPLKRNKSAAKQCYKDKLKHAWIREWQNSPRAQRLMHIDPSLPSLKFLKLTSNPDISRKGASWLFQLRTGHFPLNTYLHRFKRVENTACPACGHYSETTQHFLLDCPKYAHEQWPLITGKSQKNREYANLISNAKNAIPIIDYIQATGRFTQGESREDRAGAGNGDRRGTRRAAGTAREITNEAQR